MVKVVLVGLGAIGTEILRYLVDRGHSVVGVVDIHPEKRGKTVAELTGLPLGARVSGDIREVQLQDADVAVFATKSKISEIADDVSYAASNGLDVVTTSEEMAYPNFANPAAAQKIDALAREKGVTVVGVGVNPGFVMDLIPAAVASATKSPSSIHVVRSVDVSRRRRQLQAKTGVGLTRAKFEKEQIGGTIGHVGLVESAYLIARSMGKDLEDLKHGVFPVLGSEDYVMGVRQFAEGRAGTCQIRLDLEMTMTSADFDVVEVKGDPPLKLRFEKGVFGDSATVAVVVHSLERVGSARPGFITVLELPLSAA
ncbi:MAG TPA: Gfo/Idh/MocA family oxidoreductase [Nitrososphaerales archaeon]|nr:Gfo/Idh/MocA family oxidoreductase [Nitrososphaerales archaeon]